MKQVTTSSHSSASWVHDTGAPSRASKKGEGGMNHATASSRSSEGLPSEAACANC